MRGELAAAALDGFQVIELFLEAVGVAAREFLVAPCLGLGFAWEVKRVSGLFNSGWDGGGDAVPFFTALALSAFR